MCIRDRFCGHREIANGGRVREWLNNVCIQLIDDGASEFFLGGYGAFDRLCADVPVSYTHLYLYAGVSGATTGVTVVFSKVKLEEGSVATSWSAAPEETSSAIGQIAGALEGLDEGLDGRVQAIIDALGLSEQYASAEDFLAALEDIELIRSELSQTDSDLTLTFNRLTAAESGLAQMFSYFQFGTDDGAPYLDMGSSASSVKMRLTNTRLSFVQAGTELALSLIHI